MVPMVVRKCEWWFTVVNATFLFKHSRNSIRSCLIDSDSETSSCRSSDLILVKFIPHLDRTRCKSTALRTGNYKGDTDPEWVRVPQRTEKREMENAKSKSKTTFSLIVWYRNNMSRKRFASALKWLQTVPIDSRNWYTECKLSWKRGEWNFSARFLVRLSDR